MNASGLILPALFAFCGLSAAQGQTPASNPPGRYQPLSPRAVNICEGRHRFIRGNIVGQYQIGSALRYVVQTRKGQMTVDSGTLQELPPPCPPRRAGALAYVHSFY